MPQLANWLEAHPKVARVFYPGLPSHPQHELAKAAAEGTGAASYPSRSRAGASRRGPSSTIANCCPSPPIWATSRPPSPILRSTTHGRISPEARAAAGINEGLLRIAVGLEAVEDLQADLERVASPLSDS